MSDRRGTKSKIREIVGREERNMRLVCCGGWSLWWWLLGQEAGGVSEAAASCRGAAAAATHVPHRQLLRNRGDPASGKSRKTTAWHNAKILNLKTGQLPSLGVRQRMQSASKQSAGVLLPSTRPRRGMEWLQSFGRDQIEQRQPAISLHCLGVMREREAVGCDV